MTAPTAPPVLPAREADTTEMGLRTWVEHLRSWTAAIGSTLFDLEESLPGAGRLRDDLTLAFMVWQPVNERVTGFEQLRLDKRDGRTALVAACWQPVVTSAGEPVAADLGGAMTMAHTLVARITANRAAEEQTAVATIDAWAKVTADLSVAERLAGELGDQVRRVAQLADRAARASKAEMPPGLLAGEIAAVRADLEGVVRRRDEMIARVATASADLAELAATEAEITELATRCRQKILQAPRLAVPSVAQLTPPAELSDRPWGAVAPEAETWVRTVDRLRLAFAEARRRFSAPLAERDELRGLIQAFRAKADGRNLVEHPEVDEIYTRAHAVLWAAPCDLVAGRAVVAEYLAAVNALIAGSGAAPRSASADLAPLRDAQGVPR